MPKKLNTTPKQDGFYAPAEHYQHNAIWMLWPERTDNWRLNAKPAQAAYLEVAKAISTTTKVYMGVNATQYKNARQQLPSEISVIEISNNDAWVRDTGPTFVINDKGLCRGVDWIFNAWGGLDNGMYFPWDKDSEVAQKLCEVHGFDYYKPNIILEGGGVHFDGEGTVYTTEECLLNVGRNPTLTKDEVEAYLKDYLNIEKVIWIPLGLVNDETNGHIDEILHIVKGGEVLLTVCDDKSDPQYQISQQALKTLNDETDAKGRKIKIHKLPMPGPLFITKQESDGVDLVDTMDRLEGTRLAGSYSNFLITNGQIIYPLLDKNKDNQAKAVLQTAFPNHSLVGVQLAREILLGGGGIHCITQQIPAYSPQSKTINL